MSKTITDEIVIKCCDSLDNLNYCRQCYGLLICCETKGSERYIFDSLDNDTKKKFYNFLETI